MSDVDDSPTTEEPSAVEAVVDSGVIASTPAATAGASRRNRTRRRAGTDESRSAGDSGPVTEAVPTVRVVDVEARRDMDGPADRQDEPAPLVIVPAVQPEEDTAEPTLAVSPAAIERQSARPPVRQSVLGTSRLGLPRRARVRRVTRVVRSIDPWGVFKVALVFNTVLYLATLLAFVLLWRVAYSTGTVDNVERFMESFGWQSFEFKGGEIYHNLWILGLFGVVGLTGVAVLMATTFNLITDLVGGVRLVVLEEEVVARPARTMLQPAPRRAHKTVAKRTQPEPLVADDPDVDPWAVAEPVDDGTETR